MWKNMASAVKLFVGLFVIVYFGACFVSCKRGYMLTFPEQLQIGAPEKFCLMLYNISYGINVKMNISCFGRTAEYTSLSFHRDQHECFTWTIPDFLTPGTCDLEVKGIDEIEEYTFTEKKEIQVVDTYQITFIQTDKPMYKPGENVKFRILTIKEDLLPVTKLIERVTVQDPHGFYMKEWKDLEVKSGLASLEFKLYDEPLLGEWKIEVFVNGRKNQQTFTVEKYVLPKFQVDLKLPSAVTVASKTLTFHACAKYTFGKSVEGTMNATVCLQNTQDNWFCQSNIRPCTTYDAEISGCFQFRIETRYLKITDRTYSLLCEPKLVLDVNVTEHSTGISVHEQRIGSGVMEERIKLKFLSPKYFKPFFPYHGKLLVTEPDGKPASGEEISLTVGKLGIEKKLVSDAEGIIDFTIQNLTHHVDNFIMNAKSTDEETIDRKRYTLYAASTKKHVKQWYSPSSSYIDISRPDKDHLKCGDRLTISCVYSLLPGNAITKGYLQVISKGNILKTKDITSIVEKSSPHVSRSHGTVFTPAGDLETVNTIAVGVLSETAPQGPMFSPDGPPGYDKMAPIAPPGYLASNNGLPDAEVPAPKSMEENADGTNAKSSDNLVPNLRMFMVHVPVTHEMSPILRILVYLVTDKGEMVADTIDFNVKYCLRNKVKMGFSRKSASPGDKVGLTLSAAPNSICSTTMVDKSVFLHGGSNLLKHSDVTDKLKDLDLTSDFETDWQYCSDLSEMPPLLSANAPIGQVGPPGSSPFTTREQAPPTGSFRRKRSIQQFHSNMYDSLLAFKRAGVAALTDLDLQTRPCIRSDDDIKGPPFLPGDPNIPVPGTEVSAEEIDPAEDPEDPRTVKSNLRRLFPETWLWKLYEIPSSGTLSVNHTMGDTVTEWVGNSYCTNTDVGMGVSEVARITGFQAFFMSVKLPYAVVRGEIVNVDVLVFNFLPHCISIHVNLVDNGKFTMVESEDPSFCFCSPETRSQRFRIRPQVLGRITLTISGFLKDHRYHCKTTRAPPGFAKKQVTDIVVKHLLVQPEGMEVEKTSSHYICPKDLVANDFYKMTLTSDLPKDSLVPGSLRGWINVMGDIMGPVLIGLDKLILLPTGCGEQNMVRMSPNIAVLQYLTATRQLSYDIETRALDFLNKGYQQQLKFMHPDGSYSAFGEADTEGSTWLTAFVFKTLRQAMHFIYVDRKQIQTKSWEFLLHQQGVDGCFEEQGKVLGKYMMGGVAGSKEDKKRALTAYVLLSMLESFKMMKERTPPFIALAVKCIEVDNLTDPYTLALISYAMTLYKPDSKFTAMLLTKLKNQAVTEGNMMYWKRDKRPAILSGQGTAASAEIEMTAYALLALLTVDEKVPIKEVIPIVRWLTNQRNAYGGFSSTQDTVVALQALSKFASRIYGEGLDVTVNVATGSGDSLDFHVTGQNSILLQQQSYAKPESDVHITAKGDGCILLQKTEHYNVLNKVLPNAAFDLNVTTPVTMEILSNNCRARIVRICVRYIGPDVVSNMVVIEAKVLSGWIPDIASLKKLVAHKELGIKLYEMDERHPNVVNFYFDQLDNEELCFDFEIVQEVIVDNKQPALVRVFDYYETELEVTSFYELSDCSEDELQQVDVKLKDKDLYIEDPDDINEDFGSIYDFGEFGNEGAFSNSEKSVDASNSPGPQSQPVCPVCNLGGSSVLHNVCSKQIWTMEPKEDKLSLRVVSPGGLSPELLISVPAGLLSCPDCSDALLQGKMSVAVLTTVDWQDIGKSFIEPDTLILEWSDSLQNYLLNVLSYCPN